VPCFKCFRCSRSMFLSLMLRMLQWHISMLQAHVSSVSGVSNVYFKCFIWMLQKYIRMLYNMHVASIYFECFIRMLQVFLSGCCKSICGCCMYLQRLSNIFRCFCKYFRYMLQVFHLDVEKVDLVLNILQWNHPPQPPIGATGEPLSRRRRSPTTCAWEAEEARGGLCVLSVGRVAHAVRLARAPHGHGKQV
jgi:hypothetical protein